MATVTHASTLSDADVYERDDPVAGVPIPAGVQGWPLGRAARLDEPIGLDIARVVEALLTPDALPDVVDVDQADAAGGES